MIEKDKILAKITIVKNCLQRIKETTKLNPKMLENYDIQDVFVLNLQRAIQSAIAIANTVIAERGYVMPNTYKKTFVVLEENSWIDSKTSERMQKMVGFRNIAVHDYQQKDIDILKSILTKHLSDLEIFYKEILKKIDA